MRRPESPAWWPLLGAALVPMVALALLLGLAVALPAACLLRPMCRRSYPQGRVG